MKVDWDELKRLHAEFMAGTCAVGDYDESHVALCSALVSALPAILAEREAAQRLRDAAMLYAEHPTEMNLLELVAKALAFDNETQND